MNIDFDDKETLAIQQCAHIMDISPEKVICLALRMFQMFQLGKIHLVFPKIIEHNDIVEIETEFSNEPVLVVE